MLQVIPVGMYTDYLFPELKPTMVNSCWLIGAQSFGTGCQVHFMVPKIWRNLKPSTVEYYKCITCVYACPVSLVSYIVCCLFVCCTYSQGTAEKQPFGWCCFPWLNELRKKYLYIYTYVYHQQIEQELKDELSKNRMSLQQLSKVNSELATER